MIERKYYLAKPNPVEAIRLTPDVVALIADTSDVAHELLLTGQALYQDENDRIFQIRTGDYLVKTGADARAEGETVIGMCPYSHGMCTAPTTACVHWMGVFCELDANRKER